MEMIEKQEIRLEFADDSSDKYWSIRWDDKGYYVHYGRIGTFGRYEVKKFESEKEAYTAAQKLLNEKLKKGYVLASPVDIEAKRAALEAHKQQKEGVSEMQLAMMEGDGEWGVIHSHVYACAAVLDSFCDELKDAVGKKTLIMQAVKNAVCELNLLNEQSDYCLIETDEREEIYAFMDAAVRIAGLDTEEDITEQWREW